MTFHQRFDKAAAYYRESLAAVLELHLPHRIRSTLNNLAFLLATQGRFDEAEKLADQAILVTREANYRAGLIESLISMANLKNSQEDNETDLKLLDEAMTLVQPDSDPSISISIKGLHDP